MSCALLTAALWAAPLANLQADLNFQNPAFVSNNPNFVVQAKEMASGSGSRVNKDAESLLRYSLPINNKEVRKVQTNIEEIRTNIASKRTSAALDFLSKAQKGLKSDTEKMTKSCRDPAACRTIIESMSENLATLEPSLKDSASYLRGSDQERIALDKAYKTQIVVSKQLSQLEEQMIPAGYSTPVPAIYDDLPQLKGRATVEMVLRKPDGAPFDIEGVNFKQAEIKMVIDGYSSPVTGGSFVDLVQKGFYTKMEIQRSDGFVVQTGKPDGGADGYTGGTAGKALGAGKKGERLIPLETFLVGDKGPFYEATMEDEGRGGQATVLPFSSYGAMGWAREEYDPNSGSSQFFWLLFDSDLTPAGKNVLDGRYPCFGLAIEGADFLRDTKEGDIIVSAKVTSGLENLVLPKVQATAD